MADGKTFHLTIASVGGSLFDGEAISLTVPGDSGEMTLLAHHEPLVSNLRAGTISVAVPQGDKQTFPIESGVIECAHNRIIVLL